MSPHISNVSPAWAFPHARYRCIACRHRHLAVPLATAASDARRLDRIAPTPTTTTASTVVGTGTWTSPQCIRSAPFARPALIAPSSRHDAARAHLGPRRLQAAHARPAVSVHRPPSMVASTASRACLASTPPRKAQRRAMSAARALSAPAPGHRRANSAVAAGSAPMPAPAPRWCTWHTPAPSLGPPPHQPPGPTSSPAAWAHLLTSRLGPPTHQPPTVLRAVWQVPPMPSRHIQ